MTIRTTPITRTIKIQIFEKGKMRLVDVELLGRQEEDLYRMQHQLSPGRTYADGQALLAELKSLARMRDEQGQGIQPEELLLFLGDIEAVLDRVFIPKRQRSGYCSTVD